MLQIVLVVVLLTGLLVACIVSNAQKKPKIEEKHSELKINGPLGDVHQLKHEPRLDKTVKMDSLDSLYAKKSGKRLCPYCETLNDGGASSCCACGNRL